MLTNLLKDGGPWALLSLALVALVGVFRMYVRARDGRDDLAEKITELAEKSVEASTLQKTSNYQVAEALKALDRRVEHVERSQD